MIDILGNDAFKVTTLTSLIQKAPMPPSLLGDMGIFAESGMPTRYASIEEIAGVLHLVPDQPVDGPIKIAEAEKRTYRSIKARHIPLQRNILASALQDMRQFGSEVLVSAPTAVNDALVSMKASIAATLEWLRAGAVKGIVYDADGTTTLINLFTEFAIPAPTAVDFTLGTTTTDPGPLCERVTNTTEDALGNAGYDHIEAICGATFWEKFISLPAVKFVQYANSPGMLGQDLGKIGFPFKGITFRRYRAKIGGQPFIPPADCRFFPAGSPGLFQMLYAPANYMEAVNTVGQMVYAKSEPMEFNKGVKIEVQSNPLPLCTRPGTLIRGYSSN